MNEVIKIADFYRLLIQNCYSAGQIIQAVELQSERSNLGYMDEIGVPVPGLTPESLEKNENGDWCIPFSIALSAGGSALDVCSELTKNREDEVSWLERISARN